MLDGVGVPDVLAKPDLVLGGAPELEGGGGDEEEEAAGDSEVDDAVGGGGGIEREDLRVAVRHVHGAGFGEE